MTWTITVGRCCRLADRPLLGRHKGKLHGKQPKLSARQQAHLGVHHRTGEDTIADLAELFSVSRPTVHRVLGRAPVIEWLHAEAAEWDSRLDTLHRPPAGPA